MEQKIKSMISILFRLYGADKGFTSPFREERILSLCMNELTTYPPLEKELDADYKIKDFVMQIILDDISPEKVERI